VVRSVAHDDHLRVVIIGAGATGVELAAKLSRLLELASGYGIQDVCSRLQLTLLEAGPRTLCVLGYYRDVPAVRVWNGPLIDLQTTILDK
jgi:NADH dehydrogenase FAD-containing subunit